MVKEGRISKLMVIFLGITLLSSSFTAFTIPVFALIPGSFIDDFVSSGSGGLTDPDGLVFGPDGNLYVSSNGNDKVLRYDGSTGSFIDIFVTSGSGGLSSPRNLIFGPDGNLYIGSDNTDEVLRYDGSTGSFIDDFVSSGSGGLDSPKGLVFGPDGNLYVSSNQNQKINRYDGTTGSFIDTFVPPGSGGLNWPHSLVFGPDGNLYVSSWGTDQVLRYDGSTGSFIDDFVSSGSGGLKDPDGLVFGPDGNLYVVSILNDKIHRYDGTTGAFIATFVSGGSGGLNGPDSLVFDMTNYLYVTSEYSDEVLRYEGPFGISATCNGIIATIVGTINSEVIDGTSGDDVIVGLDGDDTINGMGGNDIICGDLGNDIITTGSGNDEIFGGDGDDTINAGDGVNHVHGDSGDDTITTGSGNDDIDGNNGNDTISSGNGNDQVYGGNGIDTIDAGDGNNYVEGNGGNDEIWTGHGDDNILGGAGNDCINSGNDPGDIIDGGSGTNLINTGSCDSAPIITISSPSPGTSFVEGALITLDGSANDPEDGDISNDISWDSDVDGILGLGNLISTSTLSVGNHVITATVTDSGGNTVSKSITIPVNIIGSPTISITEPVDSFVAIDGTPISFSVSAFDLEDGGLSDLVSWTSDIDGLIGVGSTFSLSTLSVGTHTITATVTDSDFNTSEVSITTNIDTIIEDVTTLVCHFPPGNPRNFHDLMIAPSALIAHKSHGDKLGKCSDSEKEKIELLIIKEQRKEIRDKNELKEKREELKEIKKDLNELKKEFTGIEKQKIKNLSEEIKQIIKTLNENPEYDKEFKELLKDEIKETKLKTKQELSTHELISKHKIDSKIYSLSKSKDPQKDAKKWGLDYDNGETKIVIKLNEDNQKVLNEISSISSINTKNDKYVQVTIKPSNLQKLNSIAGIEKIRSPYPAVQFNEPISEGVYFINADVAQYSGITGKGIKVAVLDLEFVSNDKISDNISFVQSFRHGESASPISWNGDKALHGTAVAEIITDVAPDVELYLYAMESDLEFAAAVDQAILDKVDVIAMSAGWPNFPTDGTSPITQKIEEAVDNGIVFVVPSGNFAKKHWEGNFVDSNFNNWHNYADSDEGLSIVVTKERIAEQKPIVSYLMWNVGMGDVADFEMVLVDPLGQIVDYSTNEQKTKSDTPFEYINHIPETEGTYSLGILYAGDMSEVSKRPNALLEIFSLNDELEHSVSHSSVSVPADAEGAIVVGAVNHLDGTLEPFSSQGPTNNGKLAPHVVGPDGVTTLALGDKPFFGTSATTPYIAGLAALVLQSHPDMSPKQVLNEIQQNTDKSIENNYDYSSGYGAASAFFLIENSEVRIN